MKKTAILNAAKGLDVLSRESELPAGAVRQADNVVLDVAGGAKRRDGYVIDLSLADASSLYATVAYHRPLTLVKAGTTLYELTGKIGSLAVSALATGLPTGPCAYAELNGAVYISAGKILRLDADGQVRLAGVASLIGFTPTLTAIAGGLPAGQYGIAFTAVNDLGEESGLSAMASITLSSAGGIRINVSGAPTAGVSSYRVYRTEQNGDLLYHAATLAPFTTTDLVGGVLGYAADDVYFDLLPAGDYLAAFNGRLYSGVGSFLYYSDLYRPGLTDPRACWLAFEGDVAGVIPVDTGIYVGSSVGVAYLQGGGPNEFQLVSVSSRPMLAGSGALVGADLFAAELVQQGSRDVALWLTPDGYHVGLPGGAVFAPQQHQISLGATRGKTATFRRDGVQQVVTAVDEVILGSGGAADTTP
jgi:hypothetical protein